MVGDIQGEKLGMSFVEYISQKRLSFAIELLDNTAEPVEKIFRKAGFTDRKSFYALFERKMNCTPTEYRKSRSKKTE
jgi:AraC-like DNA-binding protein